MAQIDFPNNPALNEEYTHALTGTTFIWNGGQWVNKFSNAGSSSVPPASTTVAGIVMLQDTLTNGELAKAPTVNVVFDALALKVNASQIVQNLATPSATNIPSVNAVISALGSGVSDGNKGDITVSGSGATWNLNADSVGTSEIAANAITASELADNAVDTNAIASGAVTAAKIAADAVGTTQIANASVTTAKIANNAITAALIANDTITAAQIAPNAITASELANNAVDTNAIVDLNVTTAKLADGAVTAIKLAAGTITSDKLAPGVGGSDIGTISQWPTNTPPVGSVLCQGGNVSRITYPDAFAILVTNQLPTVIGGVALNGSNVTIGWTDPGNTFNYVGHGLTNGIRARFTSNAPLGNTTDLTPAAIQLNVDYYVRVIDADNFQLCSDRYLVNGLALSASGSGPVKFSYFGLGDGSTTFNVPYISDFTRAVSSNNPLGMHQLDAIRDHGHALYQYLGYNGDNVAWATNAGNTGSISAYYNPNDETRSKNIALNYIIKLK